MERAGFWLIGLGLLFGLWRVWQIGQAYAQTLAQEIRLHSQLTHLQMEIAHCERLVAVLGASQAESMRAGGANPAMLRQQLQAHLAQAERDFHTLRSALEVPLKQADTPETMHWAVMRMEAEWLQLYARLQEYLGRKEPSEVNLETLHAFNLTRQDSLYAALDSLHQALSSRSRTQIHLWNRHYRLAIGLCLIAGFLLIGWIWYFSMRPAQLIHRWLCTPDSFPGGEGMSEAVLRRIRGTRWEPLGRMLVQQRQRLRAVERFMRDLAMGRTPEPLQPLEPNDPLARSSFWLVRRVEEYRRSQRDRDAV
ncbi:hypothetical protein HRbin15_01538 [bacterium HR15]|nr:hypothetical protein HRbin15_01538 [bacterium HR15]